MNCVNPPNAGNMKNKLLIEALALAENEALKLSLHKLALQKQKDLRKAKAKKRNGIIPIIDFLENVALDVNVKKTLLVLWKKDTLYYMDDITKLEFLAVHKTGIGTWAVFINTINNLLAGTIYEAHQKALQKHFKKQCRKFVAYGEEPHRPTMPHQTVCGSHTAEPNL